MRGGKSGWCLQGSWGAPLLPQTAPDRQDFLPESLRLRLFGGAPSCSPPSLGVLSRVTEATEGASYRCAFPTHGAQGADGQVHFESSG